MTIDALATSVHSHCNQVLDFLHQFEHLISRFKFSIIPCYTQQCLILHQSQSTLCTECTYAYVDIF